MALIAFGFIGLVAFIGLAIDAGIVFAHIGHLRRGVDSAALAAANQIRQGWNDATITSSAEELILLNLPAANAGVLNVVVESCNSNPSIPGCTSGGANRKLARVAASLSVDLAFMPIVGWNSVTIKSDAISEAASVDLIMVIDNSTSMAYDTPGISSDPGITDDELAACIAAGTCQPFEGIRAAAKLLVNNMFTGFDQISLVSFNRFAGRVAPGTFGMDNEEPLHQADLGLTTNQAAVIAALNNMIIYPNLPGSACPDWNSGGDPRGCTRTNTAAGLMLAGMELTSVRARPEAVKVVVLLSDGQANAAYVNNPPFNAYTPTPDDWYCPTDFWSEMVSGQPNGRRVVDFQEGPWCTDGKYSQGYNNPATGIAYSNVKDPEDAARWFADWVGCLPPGENNGTCGSAGIGAVIFTVGLGNGLIDPGFGPEPQVGARLLRYIAGVGENGDPRENQGDSCENTPIATTCGTYYYAPSTAQLGGIFQDIADRIFTRLTH